MIRFRLLIAASIALPILGMLQRRSMRLGFPQLRVPMIFQNRDDLLVSGRRVGIPGQRVIMPEEMAFLH